MDFLQKLKEKPDTDRKRPWIVRNKIVGLIEFTDGKRYPCVCLFTPNINEVPKDCWKILDVDGKKVLVCSKTLTFISAARAEWHHDKSNTVVTHAFIDAPTDDNNAGVAGMGPSREGQFWQKQMELYFDLINSNYENHDTPREAIEVLAQELAETNLAEQPAEPTAEPTAEDEDEEDYDTMPELELVPEAAE